LRGFGERKILQRLSRRILWFKFWESIKALKNFFGSMGSSNKSSFNSSSLLNLQSELGRKTMKRANIRKYATKLKKNHPLDSNSEETMISTWWSNVRVRIRALAAMWNKAWITKDEWLGSSGMSYPLYQNFCNNEGGAMCHKILSITFTVEIKYQMIQYLIFISWSAESLPFKKRISYDLFLSDETSLHLKWLIDIQSAFSLCQKTWKNDATCSKDFFDSTAPNPSATCAVMVSYCNIHCSSRLDGCLLSSPRGGNTEITTL
jgi:hypothetical protein